VSQFPVMLSYLNFGKIGTRTSILRPFITKDFMTGRPAEPGSDISEGIIHAIATQIVHNVRNIQVVGLDCSTKPPGTTEGE
jgi:GMP synthase (glutamine-hydrolysing)